MQMMTWIPYLFFCVPIAVMMIANLLPAKLSDRGAIHMACAVAVIQLGAAAMGFALLAASGESEIRFGLLWDATQEGAGYFAVNLVSLFLLMCVGLVSLISSLNANQTIKKKRTSFLNLLMALVIGMNGMLLVTDLFSLYVFLEVVGLASFVIIAIIKTDTSLEGAFKYLTMSAFASVLILTGLAFLFMRSGSLAYSDLGPALLEKTGDSKPLLVYLALIFLIAGFCLKTGAAPFHSWLPDAHQSADAAVSILLSGIVIKIAGIYSLVVFTRIFTGIEAVNLSLAVIGVFTITTGALYALRQTHFKRIVAYSSVSQMGYILLGLSTGSPLGLVGALFHVFNHATFKSTLFTNAAALHERLHTLEIDEMGGLDKNMPVTGFSNVCAFLSTAGVPPMAGFWSKLLIIMALWDNGSYGFAVYALLASILTAAYFLRLQKKVFFGPANKRRRGIKEIGNGIKFAQILLTAITIAVGVCFPLILLYLQRIGVI